MLLKYSLHEPRRGHDDIKAFMTGLRGAFPDLRFWGTADLIAEGDYVVGQWEGGGTHTGPVFSDFLAGSLDVFPEPNVTSARKPVTVKGRIRAEMERRLRDATTNGAKALIARGRRFLRPARGQ